MSAQSLFVRPEESFWRAPGKLLRFTVLSATLFLLGYLLFAGKPWSVAEAAKALEEAGKKPDLDHDITRGLWFGCAASALIGLVLVAFWKWWNGPLPAPKLSRTPPDENLHASLFWLLVVAAVVLGGYVRWNLANRSLWWDEIWSVKHASLGYLKEDANAEDGYRFLERDWKHALWTYQKPTNHPPVSAASKITQSIWRGANDVEGYQFTELAVRAPTYLAGLASILAIAILVRRWGFALGGTAAAFFLALHPWHIRYGTEARAYSLAVLWVILGCLWLTYAISDERGRWRYWLLFGLNQFLITWSLPNGFFYAAGFFFAGAALICVQWHGGAARFRAGVRLVVVNAFAAMLFLPVFMPNVLQAMRWGPINDHAIVTWERLLNTLCQMGFGMNVGGGEGLEYKGLPSFSGEMEATPWAMGIAAVLLGLGVLVGAIRLARTRPGAAIMFAALLFAAVASLLLTHFTGQHFYHRYLIYLLVPVAVCFGVGLTGLAGGVGKQTGMAAVVGLVSLGLYLYATRAPRSLLNTRPYAPFADIAESLELREEESGAFRAIGYGLGGRMLQVYYPKARFAKNKAALETELAEAEADGLPVWIVLGYAELNRNAPEYKDGFEILDQKGAFHEANTFDGIDPLFYFRILEKIDR